MLLLVPLLSFLAIAGFVRATSHDFVHEYWPSVGLDSDLNEIRQVSRTAEALLGYDVPYYIDYALQIREKGNVDTWHSGFWPPGIPLTIWGVTSLFGDNAYP